MRSLLPMLLAVTALAAPRRPVTHEDIWMMKRTGEPVVSPDGRSIVFTLTEPDYDAAKQWTDLWIVPADGSAPARRLTHTKGAESGVAWSPDGSRLAFAAKREGDEAPQIYILPLTAGGEAERVTSAPLGASNPQWRPDGKAILFESDYDPIAAERKARTWNARIYDTFPIRYWNAWLDEKKPHVFVQALMPGAPAVDLIAGSHLVNSRGFAGVFRTSGGQALEAVWTPDGRSVVFTAFVNRDETMSAETESHLFVVPAEGGEPKQITARGQSFSDPKFSPKGDALFALHQKLPERGGRLYSLSRLARFAWPAAGQPALITNS